jgi:sulfotransferase family protein
MTLEVIGAGFGRTGTMSLKVALEELGFGPCYHMTEVFANPEHIESWKAAARGEPLDWDEVFRDYRATVDWPAAAFYEELMERYPDAKVILTVRDSERWYESARNTIYAIQKTATSPPFSLGALFVPRMKRMKRAALMAADLAWGDMFDGKFEDRRHAIEVFERWNEEVKERVPPEKLLVYEVKEGWGSLCEFLEVEEPKDKPFPHLNDAETFKRMIRLRLALTVAVPTIAMSLAALALLRLRRRRRR